MTYEEEIQLESLVWKKKLVRRKGMVERFSKNAQSKMNRLIPQKAHNIITDSIKQMVEWTMTSTKYLSKSSYNTNLTLLEREKLIQEKLQAYKRTAALEGAGTGAGGIFLGLADFPLLLGIKMRYLFDVGKIYGFPTSEESERLFLLHVFQLAFSREEQKEELVEVIEAWDTNVKVRSIEWQTWQQDYRDYIDLIKMLQLVPGVGAVVGAVANYHLLDHLGETAIQCYRLRMFYKG
ncbi:EcsC family protein [Bacillus pinisoli]|uniref:EcsC family protein n=1 Tax=Bacillus pinisoli TaxID=2901866 RepID=UPI001FF31073|nr:EcsC family protein [Bacillus pinisoli]